MYFSTLRKKCEVPKGKCGRHGYIPQQHFRQNQEWAEGRIGWGPLVMRDGHWPPASLPSRDSSTVNLAKGRAKQTVYKLCVPSSRHIEGGENHPHSFSPSAGQLHRMGFCLAFSGALGMNSTV